MADQRPQKQLFVHLEIVRGAAAVLVLLHHVRVLLFPYFDDFPPELQGFWTKLLIFICGFNRPSVLVFFGLSGFLIMRSVFRDARTFSFNRYAADRLSRLWVVLIPSLIATLVWVVIGRLIWREYAGGVGYLLPHDAIGVGLLAFVGNALFLQTILLPFYGDNGPLWSLSYEFWYYALFPLMAMSVYARGLWRVASLAMCLTTGFWLASYNAEILLLFPVWLLGGIAIAVERSHAKLSKGMARLVLGAAAMVFIGVFVAHRILRTEGMMMDYLLGLAVAVYVSAAVKANEVSVGRAYEACGGFLSKISYSLYLFHNSFLGFLFYVVYGGEKVMPTAANVVIGMGLGLVTFLYCVGAWWLFERHSYSARTRFRKLFLAEQTGARAAAT